MGELDCVLSLTDDAVQCSNGPQRGGATCRFDLKLQAGEQMVAGDASGSDGFSKWERECVAISAEQLAPCAGSWETPSTEPAESEGARDPHILADNAGWQA